MKAIPVVDLASIQDDNENAGNNSDEWVKVAEKIRNGLGGIGFLYLTNHGISEETISNAYAESKAFFNLPLDIKMKFQKDIRDAEKGTFDIANYGGYMPIAGESVDEVFKYELKETYDWVSEAYSMPTTTTEETSGLHASIIQLKSETNLLHKKLLKLLAISLKLPMNFFFDSCRHLADPETYVGLENMRLLHYPAIQDDEAKLGSGAIRCGEHSDYGTLTLLFQDDVGGLEVLTTEGEWVEATPIPGSILVNTGNLMEFWTSGIFPATRHRIRIPDIDDERRSKERYSIAAFLGNDSEACITPTEEVEKRPNEIERLGKRGIVYGKEPIPAYEYMMKLVAKQYTQQ